MATRLVVFIDAQNMYQGAREAFFTRLWCHRLTKADYDAVADYTDYNIKP